MIIRSYIITLVVYLRRKSTSVPHEKFQKRLFFAINNETAVVFFTSTVFTLLNAHAIWAVNEAFRAFLETIRNTCISSWLNFTENENFDLIICYFLDFSLGMSGPIPSQKCIVEYWSCSQTGVAWARIPNSVDKSQNIIIFQIFGEVSLFLMQTGVVRHIKAIFSSHQMSYRNRN